MKFFLEPKKAILPLLEGFVDIHCHILPGLDDGAKNLEDTKKMLEAYHKIGYKKIIATPHILKGSYPNSKETIVPALAKVSSEIKEWNIISNASAEYMLDEDFEILLEEGKLLPLRDHYILIEMSYFQKPINLLEIISNMKKKGYAPVLAHPERYNFMASLREFKHLKEMGCLFQLNLLSLTKHYGPEIQKKANLLLKHNLYDFMATDAHHEGHLNKIAQISVSKKKLSKLNEIKARTLRYFALPD